MRLSALTAVLCFSSVSAFAQNAGIEVLRKMEVKFQDLKSIAGNFRQTRTEPVKSFGEKVTPGKFQILKPNYYRAELQAKSGPPEVQLISNQAYYQYIPSMQQVAVYKFKNESNVRDLNYLLLGFGAKTDEVTKVYKVTALEKGTGAVMTPRNPQEANFKYITMEVNPSTLHPTRFSMEQMDGTKLSVDIDQQALQLNPALSAANFEPNWPKGTTVGQF